MENKKENVIKKVLSIIGYSLLGLLVFIAIWLSVDKFIVKSKVPSFSRHSFKFFDAPDRIKASEIPHEWALLLSYCYG